MTVLRGLRGSVAFLTTIPVGMPDGLDDVARHMYLFPLVGGMIGSIAGLCGLALFLSLPRMVAGMLTLCAILIITGLHHLDGLADFGDGVMAHGGPRAKIRVMHDARVGVGGVAIAFVTLGVTVLCISELDWHVILQALVISETSAKLAMVTGAAFGKSARTPMGDPFVRSTLPRHFAIALIASLVINLLLVPSAFCDGGALSLRAAGLAGIFVGVLAGMAVVAVANRHFGGMTGDAFGAANEIGRAASLLALLRVIG